MFACIPLPLTSQKLFNDHSAQMESATLAKPASHALVLIVKIPERSLKIVFQSEAHSRIFKNSGTLITLYSNRFFLIKRK